MGGQKAEHLSPSGEVFTMVQCGFLPSEQIVMEAAGRYILEGTDLNTNRRKALEGCAGTEVSKLWFLW